jgi:hypothetical protein
VVVKETATDSGEIEAAFAGLERAGEAEEFIPAISPENQQIINTINGLNLSNAEKMELRSLHSTGAFNEMWVIISRKTAAELGFSSQADYDAFLNSLDS